MKPSDKTLYEFFSGYAKDRGGDRFIFDENDSYTVAQSLQIVKNLARQLQGYGIKRGDYIAVRADRTMKCIFVFYAIQFIGAVAVMCDPRELTEGSVKIVEDRLYIGGNEKILTFCPCGRGNFTATENGRETSAVIFTSGSTGDRKAVKLSQYNFINNSLDTYGIGGYRDDDVNIVIVPVHHVFGIALIMTAVVARHCIFVPQSVRTDYILDCMERYNVTRLNGVPSMYSALAAKKGNRRLESLKCGLIGGGPCTKEQFLTIERELGITLIPVYGMSECIGISCGSYADGADERCDSVGKVYSMNTVKIEEDGEVLVKGPATSVGYIRGKVTDADGWLHTGDLGYIDEKGFLHLSGRKKDIIIRNGNNLSALEIERKILSLPEVKDVCVVGIPDEKSGEVPCAMIVAETDIAGDLGRVLKKIEIPEKIIYGSELPLTSTGKCDKQSVKKLFT